MNTTTTVTPATPSMTATDDRMSQHLRALADEAEALLKDTARAGSDKLEASRERLRGEVAHLRERLSDLEARAGARIETTAHRTDAAVHAHPYSAMGVAAAIGLLAGLLIGRR
jgi:ElaB/YqjD/DUF883 family membrane-anchored ribosome-binding protein